MSPLKPVSLPHNITGNSQELAAWEGFDALFLALMVAGIEGSMCKEWRKPLETEGIPGRQPERKWGAHAQSHTELDSVNNLNVPWSKFSPRSCQQFSFNLVRLRAQNPGEPVDFCPPEPRDDKWMLF